MNIRATYLKLCLVQHPNRHTNFDDNKTANANFLIIKEAYDVLLDPVKCQQYYAQNHVSYGFPFLSDGAATANVKIKSKTIVRGINNSKHECNHKKLNSYMQLLSKKQLHTVAHHLHYLQYEESNVGDKRDVETISNNK